MTVLLVLGLGGQTAAGKCREGIGGARAASSPHDE